MPSLPHLAAVAAGGALGAVARHVVGNWALRALGPDFPWGTLVVNVVGSFLMGVLFAVLVARSGVPPEWRLFLGTGVLGGFTTFSAFSLDVAVLVERQALAPAGIYVAGSVALSILALFAGLSLARAVAP